MFKLQDQYFGGENEERKKKLKGQIDRIRDELIKYKLQNEGNEEGLKSYEESLKNKTKPYFIWELEFAKIFKDNGGFDIVIGNPPYLKELSNKAIFDPILKTDFGKEYSEGKMNFWYYFTYKGFQILKKDGFLSFIAPNYFLSGVGSKKLNNLLVNNTSIKTFIDFNKTKVFSSADIQCMVIISKKSKPHLEKKDKRCCYYFIKKQFNTNEISQLISGLDNDINNISRILIDNQLDIIDSNMRINFEGPLYARILNKINNNISKERLFKATQGIVENPSSLSKKNIETFATKSGYLIDEVKRKYCEGEEVFVLSQETIKRLNLNEKERLFLKPYHEPNHIGKYTYESDTSKHLLYINKYNMQDINEYHNIKRHLFRYREFMELRRETKKGSNKWFHLHWPRNEEIFLNEKILYPQMEKIPTFVYCDEEYYINMSTNLIYKLSDRISLIALTGLLNSKLAHFWLLHNAKNRGIGLDISVTVIDRFPVPSSFIEVGGFLEGVVNKIICKIDNNENIKGLEDIIDNMVYELYNITIEEQTIIEDYINSRME